MQRAFVLVADYLQNRYGDRIIVTPTLNFIKINKESGILQTGSNWSMGSNGVGGVTAEGSIGNWTVYKDQKRLSYNLQFSLLTNIGTLCSSHDCYGEWVSKSNYHRIGTRQTDMGGTSGNDR